MSFSRFCFFRAFNEFTFGRKEFLIGSARAFKSAASEKRWALRTPRAPAADFGRVT